MNAAALRHPVDVTPRIAARKFALVVRQDPRRAGGLVMRLRASDFRVAITNRCDQLLETIDRTPWLSLLVAEGAADAPDYVAAIADVREKHPELPILWVQPEGAGGAAAAPGGVTFADRKDMVEKAEELLGRRFYPSFMVDAVVQSVLETLRHGFNTEAEFISVSLRLTRNALVDVIPMLPFGGRGIAGHLALSTLPSQFRRIHDWVLPKKGPLTDCEKGDLGGELLNQTAGFIKSALSRFGCSSSWGCPW